MRQVHAGRDLAIHDQQDAIAGEVMRKIAALLTAGDDLLHAVHRRLEPLQLLHVLDDSGPAEIDVAAGPEEDGPREHGKCEREGKSPDEAEHSVTAARPGLRWRHRRGPLRSW